MSQSRMMGCSGAPGQTDAQEPLFISTHTCWWERAERSRTKQEAPAGASEQITHLLGFRQLYFSYNKKQCFQSCAEFLK